MPTQEYRLKNGSRVPGVTTVIGAQLAWNKGALMYWAWLQGKDGKNFRETAAAAADLGTVVHACIEKEMRGGKFDEKDLLVLPEADRDRARNSMLAFWEWRNAFHVEATGSEVPLISEEHGFGGTIDYPAIINNRRCILDLKTSKGVYADHKIQLAAYGWLWLENNPKDALHGYHLLQVGKEDGSFHHHYWPSLAKEWEAFQLLLTLHRLQKEIGK